MAIRFLFLVFFPSFSVSVSENVPFNVVVSLILLSFFLVFLFIFYPYFARLVTDKKRDKWVQTTKRKIVETFSSISIFYFVYAVTDLRFPSTLLVRLVASCDSHIFRSFCSSDSNVFNKRHFVFAFRSFFFWLRNHPRVIKIRSDIFTIVTFFGWWK